MQTWKRLMLGTYVNATWPYRCVANAMAARRGQMPISILFYHRVADDHPSPWTISNAAFAQQMEWLRSQFDLISLEEVQRRIRTDSSELPAVSITFDDGYAENCEQALPLLIQQRIPCTYFVSVDFVQTCRPFPHDVAHGHLARPNSVQQLKNLSDAGVEIGGHTRTHADLGKIDDDNRLFDEIVTSSRELESIVDRPVRYFAFPFGQRANLNSRAFHMAREHGFEAVCSAYGGYNIPGDDAFHLQRLHGDPELLRLKNWLTIDPRLRAVKRFPYEATSPRTSCMEAVS